MHQPPIARIKQGPWAAQMLQAFLCPLETLPHDIYDQHLIQKPSPPAADLEPSIQTLPP